ncbi:Na+/H+ antiporter NhaA [Streptomyces hygroscopicus]|uniref:Na+/H+ antiporter NhaA n=1 Tax=Streptomyces TaxID=1883 RepID=UPI0020A20918|nr:MULTISPECIES: Na+/H+ antiporter NhaA [unclassified Streptomyces]MCO8307711.1 Na+/H+ antiporter NhaA [Streptomyces sp. RKCA744]MDN3059031.1 Na+/H+ antiporter NhaA [Streptomyces sp. SRF1]
MASAPGDYTGQSAGEDSRTPLRDFLRTETGSAAVLVAAALAALVWANTAPAAYASFWQTHLSVRIGALGPSLPLRAWVNSGLMTLFFFVIGLEARREFDMGELRDRRRLALPLAAGISGMLVPVAVYLAVNAGRTSAHGWGAAMSTDTAFALGMLAVVGRRMPSGLRVFILTITVVDDFLALGVIAFVYSGRVSWSALLVAVGVFAVILLVRGLGVRRGVVYALLALAAWGALLTSGVDPVVIGLAMGLLTYAYPAARADLEHATGLFRRFREQPTPELERSVRAGLASALSPNDRLQGMYHPWTSYVVVPLFALANTGISLSADQLGRAFTSPVTLGILLAFVLGKPVGIAGATGLAHVLGRGRVRLPIGWGAVAAGGTLAGVGFTVSLLIATLAFHGTRLEDAKVGILSAVIGSFLTSRLVTGIVAALPHRARQRALLGNAETIIDLAVPVDPDRDHVRGPRHAPVTVVEYGDYECPYCGQAEPIVRELLGGFGDVRYVWRHLPLTDVHVHAQAAAEAAEAAAVQGRYWEMHDLLLSHQGALRLDHLRGYAADIGLDVGRFERDVRSHRGAPRVAEDVESADLSAVAGTPTFFVNGRRHHGAYDIGSLSAAVRAARERAAVMAR